MGRMQPADNETPDRSGRFRSLAVLAFSALVATAVPQLGARAQTQPSQPVAIVEDVNTTEADVGLFEYLEAGRTIQLSDGEVLILGYLGSCIRETIEGGEVIVGTKQSSVAGGLVTREEVECDGGAAELSVAEASQSGVITFRRAAGTPVHGTRSDPIRIFSADPVFVFSQQPSELTIMRLDQAEDVLTVPVEGSALNLADRHLSLASGGLYEARAGSDTRVFEIASHADTGGPLVGRVIRF